MDRYCVFGNPIAHSKSPRIHARFAELCGQTLRYEAIQVELGGFAAAARAFALAGGKGANVTVPFKHDAFALAGQLSARARLAGACNTLVFKDHGEILGDNTDGLGLVADLERNAGFAMRGHSVLLVGAGGAAAGVLGPLLQARPARLRLVNRSVDKAEGLVARHASLAADCGCQLEAGGLAGNAGRFELVINATSSSLSGAGSPIAPDALARGALAYDMMYGPAAQAFLAWAAAHGAQARDGLGMLVEQAAEAFALWRGVRPPAAQVLAELRAELDGGVP